LKEGLLLAQQVGASKVILQSDCLMVVETMGNGGFLATSDAAIYDESYSLWREFGDISIEHYQRDANRVAHELARRAFSSKSSCIWVEVPPSFILEDLVNDVTILMNQ
jgi:hypothetical protein